MAGFKCPFCGEVMSLSYSTLTKYFLSFQDCMSENVYNNWQLNNSPYFPNRDILKISFYKCSSCEKIIINSEGVNGELLGISTNIYPKSNAIQFPDYIPQAIRSDYEEACAIVNLSPKASATLSRRCLQGMIRDFWGVSKNTLFAEIDAIKDEVHPTEWQVLEAVRKLGNIGAHMEKDVNLIIDIDPEEAVKLIKLIELLMKDWYIARQERHNLYSDVLTIDSDKQSQRKIK